MAFSSFLRGVGKPDGAGVPDRRRRCAIKMGRIAGEQLECVVLASELPKLHRVIISERHNHPAARHDREEGEGRGLSGLLPCER
jgi:hypothetical protein